MKIVLQRVKEASVVVDSKIIGEIEGGLLLLVGFGKEDENEEQSVLLSKMDKAIEKISNMRIFSNESGKLDYSVLDIGGAVLVAPQFTLYGQAQKGRRPDFTQAMSPGLAEESFNLLLDKFRQSAIPKTEAGQFGADMKVSLLNDGPFTLVLEY